MSKEHEEIMKEINEIQYGIKQMLILSWINANAARRQELLTELEAIAAKNGIKLIKEVIAAIAEIAEQEAAKEMVSEKFYRTHCIFPISGCKDFETGYRE